MKSVRLCGYCTSPQRPPNTHVRLLPQLLDSVGARPRRQPKPTRHRAPPVGMAARSCGGPAAFPGRRWGRSTRPPPALQRTARALQARPCLLTPLASPARVPLEAAPEATERSEDRGQTGGDREAASNTEGLKPETGALGRGPLRPLTAGSCLPYHPAQRAPWCPRTPQTSAAPPEDPAWEAETELSRRWRQGSLRSRSRPCLPFSGLRPPEAFPLGQPFHQPPDPLRGEHARGAAPGAVPAVPAEDHAPGPAPGAAHSGGPGGLPVPPSRRLGARVPPAPVVQPGRVRLLSLRRTGQHSRDTGSGSHRGAEPPPLPGGRHPPAPATPRSARAQLHAHRHLSSGSETLRSFQGGDEPPRGPRTGRQGAWLSKARLSTLLEPQCHLSWATGAGEGTPEWHSPKPSSARQSCLTERRAPGGPVRDACRPPSSCHTPRPSEDTPSASPLRWLRPRNRLSRTEGNAAFGTSRRSPLSATSPPAFKVQGPQRTQEGCCVASLVEIQATRGQRRRQVRRQDALPAPLPRARRTGTNWAQLVRPPGRRVLVAVAVS